MAEDIRITITGDNKDLKKVLKVANKLVKRFEKAHGASTQRRVRKEERASEQVRRAEERKNRRLIAMDRRLSRKRARIRLKRVRENIRAIKRIAAAEERANKRRAASFKKYAKFGLAGLGIGGVAGIVIASRKIMDFDMALTRLSASQFKSIKWQAALREEIMKTTLVTGVKRNSLLEMITAIIAKSGDLDLATKNVEKLGMLLMVKGEEFAEPMGEFLAAMSKPMKAIPGLGPIDALEAIIAQGTEGSIVMEEMAAKGQEIAGSFAALKRPTKKAFAEYMGILQLLGTRVGAEKAITSLTLLFSDLERIAPKLKKNMKWDIYEKPGLLKRPAVLMKEMMKYSKGIWTNFVNVGGATVNIQRMFDALGIDMQANNDELKDMEKFITRAMESSGIIRSQFERMKEVAGFTFARLETMVTTLTDKTLAENIDILADAIERMLSDKQGMKDLQETFGVIGDVLRLFIKGGIGVAKFTKMFGGGLGIGAAKLTGIDRESKEIKKLMELYTRRTGMMGVPPVQRTEEQRIAFEDLRIAIEIQEGKVSGVQLNNETIGMGFTGLLETKGKT